MYRYNNQNKNTKYFNRKNDRDNSRYQQHISELHRGKKSISYENRTTGAKDTSLRDRIRKQNLNLYFAERVGIDRHVLNSGGSSLVFWWIIITMMCSASAEHPLVNNDDSSLNIKDKINNMVLGCSAESILSSLPPFEQYETNTITFPLLGTIVIEIANNLKKKSELDDFNIQTRNATSTLVYITNTKTVSNEDTENSIKTIGKSYSQTNSMASLTPTNSASLTTTHSEAITKTKTGAYISMIKFMDVNIDGNKYHMPYISSYNPEVTSSIFTNLLFIIHGNGRNALDYYRYGVNAAIKADARKTIVIVPKYLTEEDMLKHDFPPNTLYWSSSGWKIGNKSQGRGRASSFRVLEELIGIFIKNIMGLQSIVIAGHSAGGQFVNRFAAGNSIETYIRNIKFYYVVANPSSYLYFTPKRAFGLSRSDFASPNTTSITYNHYKYGLENLSGTSYMSEVGKKKLVDNYRKRNVTYLLGEEDTINEGDLDISEAAMLQGGNRLERGLIYYNYLVNLFGDAIKENHHKVVIPGVGHNAERILQSKQAMLHLFRYDSGHDDIPSDKPTDKQRIKFR